MTSTPDSARRPRLVFGDDGAPPADTAWRWVTSQPWPGWDIEVLTADAGNTAIEWGAPPREIEWTPTWTRTEEIHGAGSVRFTRVATDPRAMLAERERVDLMVLGLRTHSFLQGVATGSTTEWLLHHPPSPLVVARSPEAVRRVTLCVDGSAHAMAALEAFTSLPLAGGARTVVLAVDDGRADAQRVVAEAAAALDGSVADMAGVVREGHPTPTILSYLLETLPELVVMGTRGLTGWQRLVLGSTASAVVRGAPCTSLVASTDTALV